jgi:hypothetical protein
MLEGVKRVLLGVSFEGVNYNVAVVAVVVDGAVKQG